MELVNLTRTKLIEDLGTLAKDLEEERVRQPSVAGMRILLNERILIKYEGVNDDIYYAVRDLHDSLGPGWNRRGVVQRLYDILDEH